ncbi:MAG TPA: hypothetical protein VNP92_27915 [Actinophytocola sp.]|nr:hypothetical protein [Actinophytocola sp.]
MRRRNAGPRPVETAELLGIMAAAVEAVARRLPGQSRETVERAVYDVAAELVSTVTDPDRLATMLRLRATARLSASTGTPIPIQSRNRRAVPQ